MKLKIFTSTFLLCMLHQLLIAQFTKLYDFDYNESGGYPYHVALVSDGTYLYGTNSNGGLNSDGTIYRIKPDGTDFQKILDFSEIETGNVPEAGVIFDGQYLYGNTKFGGAYGHGTIYRVKPDGTDFLLLHEFPGDAGGAEPHGVLYNDGTYLYGMVTNSGVGGGGLFFKVRPDGTDYSVFFNLEIGETGVAPYGGFISDGEYLYGMTVGGGTGNLGTTFKIKPDGTGYETLINFTDDPNGAWGYGSLVYDGDFLYGMTNNGGEGNRGTIFKVKTDGTEYEKLLDFDDVNGAQPLGSLILEGTTLYGMAELGGDAFQGTLFSLKTDGSDFNVDFEFDGDNSGGVPYGTLVYESGALFGVTGGGGDYGRGTIFRFGDIIIEDPINSINANQFQIYPNPAQNNFKIILDENQLSSDAKLEIINMQGSIIYTSDVNTLQSEINITQLVKGMYLVKVISGLKSYNSKLIIQ